MADISSVSSQIQQLENSYDLWNSITLWLLAATAIVGVFVFGASRMVNREAKRLDEARKLLSQLKDEQQQKEKAESDEKIAAANKGVATSNVEIARLKAESANLQLEIARARKETEQERLERVKLEAQVAPRRLTREQQKAIAASLKPFNGRRVRLLTYVYDLEGGILTSQIKPALLEAGIIVEDRTSSVMIIGGFIAGILVNGPLAEQDLVKALVNSLTHEGKLSAVENRGTTQVAGTDPTAVANILVGFKPPPPEPK